MEKGTILIVDDNKGVLASLELLLETEFSEIKTAHHPNQIMSILNTSPVDVIILDMNFSAGINNGNEGLYWLKRIREIAPALPVVMLTAYGDVELAVRALKNDATDFLLKPWDNRTLVCKIKEAFGSGKKRKNRVPDRSQSPMIVGTSPAMQQLMKMVVKVARTDANILITGENGTGKEMLAQEIHRLSTRREHTMVTVDMGAISESLFESELFGHERGSFTDAYESRPGKFEAASGSSLFMDEIGNLPLAMQAKLLTVLQNRKITRIGSNKVIPVDIRLLSATNKNIQEMVDSGTFREDLLYRLNTIHLEIPPLRERGKIYIYSLIILCNVMLLNTKKKIFPCMNMLWRNYVLIIGREISGNYNMPSRKRSFYVKEMSSVQRHFRKTNLEAAILHYRTQSGRSGTSGHSSSYPSKRWKSDGNSRTVRHQPPDTLQ